MNLKQVFSYQNLFEINAAFVSPQEKLFAFAGGVMVLIGIALKVASVLALNPVDKKYRSKFYHLFFTIGLLELFWYLCRYENISFFGTKFVAWLYALIGLVWFVVDIVTIIKNYKKEKEAWEKQTIRNKYLPV